MTPLNSWKQQGIVSLWQYTERQRNFPGWHLSADSSGIASLLDLLTALAETPAGDTRTISIVQPTRAVLAVPNNGEAQWIAPERLRVSRADDPSIWLLPPSSSPAELTVGLSWLTKLREGIAGIARGRGDYSIGDKRGGSLPLWFWWQ